MTEKHGRQPRGGWCGWLTFILSGIAVCSASEPTTSTSASQEAVVVYNLRVPESKEVADHYVLRRGIPTNQLFGLDLPNSEEISRADFQRRLQQPLRQLLSERRLLTWSNARGSQPRKDDPPPVSDARIRYLVLCYGVPLRVAEDASLKEEAAEKLRVELRRNGAAVDSELACLPLDREALPLVGPMPNPAYSATNAALVHPTNGVLMVARLDGPTAAIAKGLVDKALQAEADGFWGRAYFDLRGLTNGSYQLGDTWIGNAAAIAEKLGFETLVDKRPETFPAGFPLSQVALYAGWYDANVSGPFARPTVEFMPGAFAYHLHSFSAATLHSPTQNWVGPLLAKGASASMGCVAEPYLEGTPDIGVFMGRFLFFGFTFGEAAYACQGTLSWQTTVVGDPLYRPFAKPPQVLHEELRARSSKLIEWSHLRVVNLNLASGMDRTALIDYLRKTPETPGSAVLLEKLADLCYDSGRFEESIENYVRALRSETSEQQRVRLILNLARTLTLYQRKEEAFALYQEFLKRYTDYPDRSNILQRLVNLGESLGHSEEATKYRQELDRLATPLK